MLKMSCIFALAMSTAAFSVPVIEASFETDPIPHGEEEADDPAIWTSKAGTVFLGTSKYEEGELGGLGVYTAKGSEKQFLGGAKLNNIDIASNGKRRVALASNRTRNSLNIYALDEGTVKDPVEISLLDKDGASFEPYGLCLGPWKNSELTVFLPTKAGTLHQYTLDEKKGWAARWKATYELDKLISPALDKKIHALIWKDVVAGQEEDEYQEDLDERFTLEGCVYDAKSQNLYVSMENAGIWRIDLNRKKAQPKLMIEISASWTEAATLKDKERVTDDIEGVAVFYKGKDPYMIFSNQGINEYSLYDLRTGKILGNFKVAFGKDPVTATDGLDVIGPGLSSDYPKGVFIIHDDQNTDDDGSVQNGNFKIVPLDRILKVFSL